MVRTQKISDGDWTRSAKRKRQERGSLPRTCLRAPSLPRVVPGRASDRAETLFRVGTYAFCE